MKENEGQEVRGMSEKKSYAGKIKNTGAQFVEALHKQPKVQDHSRVHKGKDLRATAGGKKA